ncbi:hypothetical protein ILYODFUR_019726 [Ilyodon furcidens]|uniref:Uncharacterized protein n=1 Tax=Ilyodon furcidens TaxID=33524 RepID=A0ABV0UKL4_9TELE
MFINTSVHLRVSLITVCFFTGIYILTHLEICPEATGNLCIYALKMVQNGLGFFKMGCMVVQLVALLPCSKKVLSSIPGGGLSAWSLHVLPVHAWVLTGYSGFLQQSKDMHVRLIDHSKLPLGV